MKCSPLPRQLAGLEAHIATGELARRLRVALCSHGGAVLVVGGIRPEVVTTRWWTVAAPDLPGGRVHVAPAGRGVVAGVVGLVAPWLAKAVHNDEPPSGCAWVAVIPPWPGALLVAAPRGEPT